MKVTPLQASVVVFDNTEEPSAQRPGIELTQIHDEKDETRGLVSNKPKEEPGAGKAKQQKGKPKPIVSKMNNYAQYDKFHPLNQPFPALENFKGPKLERKPTDILGILLPFLMGGVFVFHLVVCHLNGWPTLLTKPLDFRAKMCGIKSLAQRPYLYFLAPSIDLNVAMCVEECPATTGKPISVYDSDGSTLTPFVYTRIQCDRIGKFCFPVEPTPRKKVDNFLNTPVRYVKRIIGELFLVLLSLCLAVVNALCFGILFGLRKKLAIKAVVWGAVTLTVICLEVFGFMCYRKYNETIKLRCLFAENRHGCGGLSAMIYIVLSIFFWVIGFIYLASMAFYFNQINLVIGIMGAALKVTNKASEIKSAPVVSGIMISGVCMCLLWLVVEAGSIGEIKKVDAKNIDSKKVKIYKFNDFHLQFTPIDAVLAYYLMLFFLSFIEAITSYAICIWFFSKKKDTTRLDLQRCFKDHTKFHLGTVAVLAFLKLIFKPIRLISRPLYESLASANQKNFLIRFLQVACSPCVWLHHKLLRFLGKSTLIQVSMWSTKYSIASKQSYYLASVRHGDRGIGNHELIEFVMRQIKLSMSLLAGLLFYLYLLLIPYSPSFKSITDVADPIVGSLIVFCFGIFVASSYTGTYDMIIKTVVQCNYMDEEMFVGDQKFTEPFLDELMGYWKKNDDDDKMNPNAQQVKKKEIQKEAIDFDNHYKEVRAGDEDIKLGPSSEEEDVNPNDMFAESKRRKVNRDQDFNEDFLKSSEFAKPLTGIKELAKSLPQADAQFNVQADMDDDDYPSYPIAKSSVLPEKEDVSFDLQDKPKIFFVDENDEPNPGPSPMLLASSRKSPKPILKGRSTQFIDDNMSVKSGASRLSKKKKVDLHNVPEKAGKEVKPDIVFGVGKESEMVSSTTRLKVDEDDNKSSRSKKVKREAEKIEASKASPVLSKKEPEIKFSSVDEPDFLSPDRRKDSKSPLRITLNKKSDPMDDNVSAKLSKKSLKSKKGISSNTSKMVDLPMRGSPAPLPVSEAPKPQVQSVAFYGEDDDRMSGKQSVGSKRKANKQRDIAAREDRSTERRPALDKVLAAPRYQGNPQAEFEDDFFGQMEKVVDKDQSIKILNASQGLSMVSKNKSAANNQSSVVRFQYKDDSDKDDDNYF